MVNDQVMGRLVMSGQKERLFDEGKGKKEQRLDLSDNKIKLIVYC